MSLGRLCLMQVGMLVAHAVDCSSADLCHCTIQVQRL